MNIDQLLIKACSYGIVKYVEKYIDMGSDVNGKPDYERLKVQPYYDVYGYTPLYISLVGEFIDCAEYLIKRGANVNTPQGLIVEIICSDAESFYFNAYEAETISKDSEPEMDGVKLLLKNGAHINSLNIYGETALEKILVIHEIDHKKTIDFLIKNGANINLKNKDGKTPLDIAKTTIFNKVIKYLIDLGAKTSEELKEEVNKDI